MIQQILLPAASMALHLTAEVDNGLFFQYRGATSVSLRGLLAPQQFLSAVHE